MCIRDSTSTLRFLETRFGAEVPNLSEWRRSVTGDLTSALNFAGPDQSVPVLPAASLDDPRITGSSCTTRVPLSIITEIVPGLQGLANALQPPYPVPPPPQEQPGQEPGVPRRPSGPVRRSSV